MKVYVVQGTYGEYSDREQYIVKIFKKEAKAKKFIEQASDRIKQYETARPDISLEDYFNNKWEGWKYWEEYDDNIIFFPTYWYDEIELE